MGYVFNDVFECTVWIKSSRLEMMVLFYYGNVSQIHIINTVSVDVWHIYHIIL